MRKFITNILFFSLFFVFLHWLPSLFLSPYYGNDYYSKKYKHFIKNEDKYNTVILGSSRLYRHVNPKKLDGLLKDYQTSTFNLAVPSTFNPEVYYLYENLLKKIEDDSLKYAFVEITSLSVIGKSNLPSARNYYWHNLEYLGFSFKYILTSSHSLSNKIRLINRYFTSYFYKIINVYKDLKIIISNQSSESELLIGKNKDGFYSLDEQMNDIGGNNRFTKRLTSFKKNTTILEERISITNQAFSWENHENFINEVHLIKLIDLIENSKAKGVHLVFVIVPRLANYNELLAIKEKLPPNHVIELANPQKYPELYQVEFSFDDGHLNERGADIFTKYFANELRKNVFSIKVTEFDRPVYH